LCPEESAWKLSAVFARKPGAEYTAQESLTLGNLQIPAMGIIRSLGRSVELSGADFTLDAVCGPGLYRLRAPGLESRELSPVHQKVLGNEWFFVGSSSPTNTTVARGTIYAGVPFLAIRLTQPNADAQLSLSGALSDETPVEITQQHSAGEYRFLCLPASSRESLVDSVLHIDLARTFEFLLAPPPVSATNRTSFPADSSSLNLSLIPTRDPDAPRELIDLSAFYNATLGEDWHRQVSGNDLAHFPPGIHSLAGTDFDIRGIVQLGSSDPNASRFPSRIEGIAVNRSCVRLHFLQASGWTGASGTRVGRYVVRYADGETVNIPLVYGVNTEDWWSPIDSLTELTQADSVWLGANRASLSLGEALQLYRLTWKNPRPDTEIVSLDFISAMATPAPFLVALTADP